MAECQYNLHTKKCTSILFIRSDHLYIMFTFNRPDYCVDMYFYLCSESLLTFICTYVSSIQEIVK